MTRPSDVGRDWSWTTERNRRVRQAGAAARRAHEAAYPGVPYVAPGPYTHGLRSTHENHGCQCGPCVAAAVRWKRNRTDRAPHLPSDSRFWAACRRVDAANPDGWTAAQVAAVLGVSGRQVPRRLGVFADEGRLVRVKASRAGVLWQISRG